VVPPTIEVAVPVAVPLPVVEPVTETPVFVAVAVTKAEEDELELVDDDWVIGATTAAVVVKEEDLQKSKKEADAGIAVAVTAANTSVPTKVRVDLVIGDSPFCCAIGASQTALYSQYG